VFVCLVSFCWLLYGLFSVCLFGFFLLATVLSVQCLAVWFLSVGHCMVCSVFTCLVSFCWPLYCLFSVYLFGFFLLVTVLSVQCLPVWFLSFGHCIVCSSFTASYSPFDIIKLSSQRIKNVGGEEIFCFVKMTFDFYSILNSIQ
jgi:hypothetical protein